LPGASLSEEDHQRQLQFFSKIRDLRQKVKSVESLQIHILITLLGANDFIDGVNGQANVFQIFFRFQVTYNNI
jgi:hypothetical protein